MKTISSRHSSKKRLILIGIIVAIMLSIAGVGVYLYISQNSTDTGKDKSGRADEIKKNTPEKSSGKNNSTSSSNGLPNDSTEKTTDQVPTDSSLSVTITSTSQSNGQVKASAQTSADGTCVFQYTTDGDKPVVSQVEASNSSCSTSIPEVQFAKLGAWQLKVTLYSNSKKAETTTNVTIN